MQNIKIKLWALGMAGYNCTIEYIFGTENICADLLSRKPNGVCVNEALDSFDLDNNDNTFEVGVINSNEIDPKDFAGCTVPELEQMEVLKCDLPGLNMTVEQAKDKNITDLGLSVCAFAIVAFQTMSLWKKNIFGDLKSLICEI